MDTDGFRKLDLDLPRAPIHAVGPWLLAGILLALLFLLLMAGSYYRYKKETPFRRVLPGPVKGKTVLQMRSSHASRNRGWAGSWTGSGPE